MVDKIILTWHLPNSFRSKVGCKQFPLELFRRFYEITKSEVKQIDAELLNMDRRLAPGATFGALN